MKKYGFIEMECAHLDEIKEFETYANNNLIRFVTYKSMMTDDIAEVYVAYGEFFGTEIEEFAQTESAHGHDELIGKFESIFGKG